MTTLVKHIIFPVCVCVSGLKLTNEIRYAMARNCIIKLVTNMITTIGISVTINNMAKSKLFSFANQKKNRRKQNSLSSLNNHFNWSFCLPQTMQFIQKVHIEYGNTEYRMSN